MDSPPARDPRRDQWLLIGVLGAAALFIVALTAGGARGLGRDRGHPDYGSVLVRAAIGALIALVIAAVVGAVVGYVARTSRRVAGLFGPEWPLTRRTLTVRSLPWLAVALSLGAVIGASTAPLHRAGTSGVDDSAGNSVDPRLPTHEGRLTEDQYGELQLQVDTDGDGTFESYFQCPGDYENNVVPYPDVFGSPDDDTVLVPLDEDCDGELEGYARLDPGDLANPVPFDPAYYDGTFVEDAEGRLSLVIDADGDGQFDTPMVWCPAGTPNQGMPTERVPSGETALLPIDENCDGSIDAYARVDGFDPDAVYADPPDMADPPGTLPPRPDDPVTAPPDPADDPADGGSDAAGDDGGGLSLQATLLIGALIGTALIAIAYLGSRALLRAPDPEEDADDALPEPEENAAASGAIRSSLDELAASPDPRAAIIGAYARLLDGLATAGMPRRPNETPEMYLQRCVKDLRVRPEPMQELTGLFTVARFSSHPLDESHRQRASQLLQQTLDDVRREPAMVGGAAR